MVAVEGSVSTEAEWKRQIEDLQTRSRLAYLAKDIEQLNAFWSEEFVVNSPMGRVMPRDEVLRLLQGDVISHISYEERIETMVRFDDVVVVMGGDVVVNRPSTPEVPRRFTNVWRAAGDSWRLVARHAGPALPPPRPA
jgi:hypothetical protein